MKTYRLCLVDMDDTLYEERTYVLSGFRVVSRLAAKALDSHSAEIFDFMSRYFETKGRVGVLDALLEAYGREPDAALIAAWVEAYRHHQPDIALYPSVRETLGAIRASGASVYIVTDGLTCMQQRKFSALGLKKHVDGVVYCHEVGFPKPDARALSGLVAYGQDDAVLIGDRPDHDLALAANIGIDCIRVRTARFGKHDNAPWEPVVEVEQFAVCKSMLL